MPRYWLGERFEGLEATYFGRPSGPQGPLVVAYGTCEIRSPQTEGGCTPPLQLQSVRMCFLDTAATTVRMAPVERRRIFRVGPNAAINRGGTLVILARDHEVRIFAHRASQARRAATKLKIANAVAGSGTLAGRLAAAPRAADQRVPCEGNPPPEIVTLPPGVVPTR